MLIIIVFFVLFNILFVWCVIVLVVNGYFLVWVLVWYYVIFCIGGIVFLVFLLSELFLSRYFYKLFEKKFVVKGNKKNGIKKLDWNIRYVVIDIEVF